MSAIFGGSKSKQQSTSQQSSQAQNTSYNKAYDFLQDTYAPVAQQGTGASKLLASLLGYGDPGAFQPAFDNYKSSAGYDFILDSGSRAITGNAASKGMLNSGATLKALNSFGQNTASQFYNNFLDRLLGASNQGMQAGNLISGAGNYGQGTSSSQGTSNSTSSSSSKPGIGGFIGSVASALPALSDRRLKTDIVPVGEVGGLTVYDFRYEWDEPETVRRGYMADEVEVLYPEALGPVMTDGYKTVRYDRLPSFEGIVN